MITLQKAKQAVEAAERKALELGVAVSTVIVDEHGTPIVMSRMDDAFYISPRFAETKAYTSAMLKMPTHDIAPYAIPEKPYYGITNLFGGALTTMAGGLPIISEGKVIGAVGVGGSADVQQDVTIAQLVKEVLETK